MSAFELTVSVSVAVSVTAVAVAVSVAVSIAVSVAVAVAAVESVVAAALGDGLVCLLGLLDGGDDAEGDNGEQGNLWDGIE